MLSLNTTTCLYTEVKFLCMYIYIVTLHFLKCDFITAQALIHLKTHWFWCFLCTISIGVAWRCYTDVVLIRTTATKATVTTRNVAMNWLYWGKRWKEKNKQRERKNSLQHRTPSEQQQRKKLIEESALFWVLPFSCRKKVLPSSHSSQDEDLPFNTNICRTCPNSFLIRWAT